MLFPTSHPTEPRHFRSRERRRFGLNRRNSRNRCRLARLYGFQRVNFELQLHYSVHQIGLLWPTIVVYRLCLVIGGGLSCLSTGVSRLISLYMERSTTSCVSVLGSRLPCPGGGIRSSSMNRSVTGCVPPFGGGLPCPGLGSIGSSSMNQSVTGCVPALGGMSCPGVGIVCGSSANRSVTGCIPALDGGMSCLGSAGSAIRTWVVSVWHRSRARHNDAVPDKVCLLPHLQLPDPLVLLSAPALVLGHNHVAVIYIRKLNYSSH